MKRLLCIAGAVLGLMLAGVLLAYGPSPHAVAVDVWNDSSLTVARRIVEVVGGDTIFCDSSTFYFKEGNLIVITKSGDSLVFNVDSIPWDWLMQAVKDSIQDSIPWNQLTQAVKDSIQDSIPWSQLMQAVKDSIQDSIPWAQLTQAVKDSIQDSIPWTQLTQAVKDSIQACLVQGEDTILVDTLNFSTDTRFTRTAAGQLAIEERSGAGSFLAVGNTSQTGASGIAVTDGGTDKPGWMSQYADDGNAMYSWFDANHIKRYRASVYSDPDADGYRLIDADNGNTYSTDLHSVYRNDADTITGMLKVEQDGTGDVQLNMFLTGSQYYNVRLDNSDNDNFKIALNDGLDATADTTIFEVSCSTGVKGVISLPRQIDARMWLSDSQTVDSATVNWTKVALDNVNWYTNCIPDSTVNYRVTVQETGKYQVNGRVAINVNEDTPLLGIAIYVDGAAVAYGTSTEGSGRFVELASTVSDVLSLTPGQYVEMYVRATGITNATFKIMPGTAKTYLSLVKVK